MANGLSASIENIKIGDVIVGYDISAKKLVEEKVLQTYIHTDSTEPIIVINKTLKATANHPFYVKGSWIDANKLKLGDKLTYLDDNSVKLLTITSLNTELPINPVYNITTSGGHDYFADGVLVHNKPAPIPTRAID